MQKVVLQARNTGCQDVEPFGRDQGENGTLGWDAVLGHTVLASGGKRFGLDAAVV